MIQKVYLKDFRNFEDLVIQFSPKINILLGENGQGKSNLLEAILILTSGDSFRTSENDNLIRKNSSQSFLKASAVKNDLHFELESFILKSKKNHLINKKKTNIADLIAHFPSVVFSPESLSAIKDASDQRRRLVDDLLINIYPRSSLIINDFKKALKTRNRVLKNFISNEISRQMAEDLLESLQPTYIRLAVELSCLRIKVLREILPEFNKTMKMISNQQNVDILVEYVISDQNALHFSTREVQELIERRLNQLHDAELSSGVSLGGPQKHDLRFLYGGNDSRFFCSQGQQRALILSFKIAQIVYHRQIHGSYPLLLLDDVLSELDAGKRESLIRFVSDVNTQVFITTTDFTLPESLRSEDCAVIRIREGKIGF